MYLCITVEMKIIKVVCIETIQMDKASLWSHFFTLLCQTLDKMKVKNFWHPTVNRIWVYKVGLWCDASSSYEVTGSTVHSGCLPCTKLLAVQYGFS